MPVMHWIGKRIEMVEKVAAEAPPKRGAGGSEMLGRELRIDEFQEAFDPGDFRYDREAGAGWIIVGFEFLEDKEIIFQPGKAVEFVHEFVGIAGGFKAEMADFLMNRVVIKAVDLLKLFVKSLDLRAKFRLGVKQPGRGQSFWLRGRKGFGFGFGQGPGGRVSLKGRAHGIESLNVGDFELHGPGAGEAHGQKRETVFGQVVRFTKFALGISVFNQSKIGRVKGFRAVRPDFSDVTQDMIMPFVKKSGDVGRVGDRLVVDEFQDGDELFGHADTPIERSSSVFNAPNFGGVKMGTSENKKCRVLNTAIGAAGCFRLAPWTSRHTRQTNSKFHPGFLRHREKGQKDSQCYRVGVSAYRCVQHLRDTLTLPLKNVKHWVGD